MTELLLNSKCSDDFNLGRHEYRIPNDLSDRIIRHKIDLQSKNIDEVVQFFKGYNKPPDTLSEMKKAMEEFFLEKFFKKIREKEDFDSIDYVELGTDKRIRKGNYWYMSFNEGRSIKVYTFHKSKPKGLETLREISRIAVIRKGETKQVIICDPRVSSYPKREDVLHKLESTKPLVGGEDMLSYMMVSTRNLAKEGLRRKYYKGSPMYSYYLVEFLSENNTNLCLVYSADMHSLTSYGHSVIMMMGLRLRE